MRGLCGWWLCKRCASSPAIQTRYLLRCWGHAEVEKKKNLCLHVPTYHDIYTQIFIIIITVRREVGLWNTLWRLSYVNNRQYQYNHDVFYFMYYHVMPQISSLRQQVRTIWMKCDLRITVKILNQLQYSRNILHSFVQRFDILCCRNGHQTASECQAKQKGALKCK